MVSFFYYFIFYGGDLKPSILTEITPEWDIPKHLLSGNGPVFGGNKN